MRFEKLRVLRRKIRSLFSVECNIQWNQVVNSLTTAQINALNLSREDLEYSRYASDQQQTTAIDQANTAAHSYGMHGMAEQITALPDSRERQHLSRIFNFVYGQMPESIVFRQQS